MCAVPTCAIQGSSGLSYDRLEARLAREVNARLQAEHLLEEKSRSLYTSNSTLERVAKHLEEQRQQLDIILDNTIGGIFLTNEKQTILRANGAGMTMFGLDQESVLAKKIFEFFEDESSVEQFLNTAVQSHDTSAVFETEAHTLTGQVFPVELSVKIVEHTERTSQYVWILRDITRRKKEEAERAELEKELSQAQKLEALGTLASGVAHEINTPIQYVGDNLRFLQETFSDLMSFVEWVDGKIPGEDIAAKKDEIDLDFLTEEAPASIQQSLYGLEQVARIVKAIKEFSHPGSGDAEKVNLNDLLSTAATLSKNQWKYVADIDYKFDENLPEITCYTGDVSQVLVNMIVNAADAMDTSSGTERGTIILKSSFDGDNIYLEICDTGSGMTEEVVERIFDPFFTTKDVGKGTGQGLAISYNIIHQKHGGDIQVNSKPGVGTRFLITLPRILGGYS
jgi:PAS domain S-box-containing protein